MSQHKENSSPQRAHVLAESDTTLINFAQLVERLGIEVDGDLFSSGKLKQLGGLLEQNPMLVRIESAPQQLLAELEALDSAERKPTVVFAKHYDKSSIDSAVQAGVDAYLVEEPNELNVQAAIRFAKANYAAKIELAKMLNKTRRRLGERAEIERAKYQLMLNGDLNEVQAHALMRSMAMNDCTSMGVIAKNILDFADQRSKEET